MDDIFRVMSRGRVFSAMDLLWGFYQVRLREDSILYTAFATPDSLYEDLVTPMGVSSSPLGFNRLVQNIFSDQQDFCQTYFDGIFVFTSTGSIEDHLVVLEKVFERCKMQQLFIKLSKGTFCAAEIPCLGDRISWDDVRMDPPKSRTHSQLASAPDQAGIAVLLRDMCLRPALLSRLRSSPGPTHRAHEREESQRVY
ncbi:hypothetical protein PC121_g1762 [Phytophthora cactorum]|nr:hypothetical protein PC120_g1056 [Phytophthora cactorum]KAG3100078.1 hypothetical protein PC121_g1762 [Phytophthora cactorum]